DHWFGTGGNKMNFYKGLDLWTVVWVGARLSLILGTVVALIDTFLGILIGSLWGYFRRLDPIMIEIRNFVNNVPSLLLYFLLMAFLTPDFWTIVFLLTMFGWIGLAGFIRNQIIIIRNRDYNIASVTLGSSPKAMITRISSRLSSPSFQPPFRPRSAAKSASPSSAFPSAPPRAMLRSVKY
ncbi:MAG: ABC transporter permease subunit, partial [Bacilli bacterium]